MKYLVTEQQQEIYKIIRRKKEVDSIFQEAVSAYEPCDFVNDESYKSHILRLVSALVSAEYDTEIINTRKLIEQLYRSYLIDKYNEECK
jgi:hypothetical protein